MKRSVLVAALSAFVLSSCGSNVQEVKSAQTVKSVAEVKKPDPSNPQVSVKDGKIVIDQEKISFEKEKKNVKITWQLPDSNYSFTSDGIEISKIISGNSAEIDCKTHGRGENGLTFSCMNKHSIPGEYKYTIRVKGPAPEPLTLDPIVAND